MDLIALVESIVYAPHGGKPSDDGGDKNVRSMQILVL